MESGRTEGLAQNTLYDIVFLFLFFHLYISSNCTTQSQRESPWTTHTVNIHFYWDKGLCRQHARAGGGFTTRRTLRRRRKKRERKKKTHELIRTASYIFLQLYTASQTGQHAHAHAIYAAKWLVGWSGAGWCFSILPGTTNVEKTFDIKRKKKIKKVGITPHPPSLLLSFFLNFNSIYIIIILKNTKIIESTRKAKQTKVVIVRRVRWRSRLGDSLQGEDIYSFSFGSFLFPGRKKKQRKQNKT